MPCRPARLSAFAAGCGFLAPSAPRLRSWPAKASCPAHDRGGAGRPCQLLADLNLTLAQGAMALESTLCRIRPRSSYPSPRRSFLRVAFLRVAFLRVALNTTTLAYCDAVWRGWQPPHLAGRLKAEAGKSRKRRRTAKQLPADLVTPGFTGSYARVAAFARRWRADRMREPKANVERHDNLRAHIAGGRHAS